MDGEQPRQARVKNKAAAPIQISAEQLLREASERLDPNDPSRQVRKLIDENVDDYRQRNRQFFEDKLRRDRSQMGVWIRYAAFEEGQKEYARARSVYERALDCDPYNITVFLKYSEMEMKLKNVNLARNIWDRAVTIQPRVGQFWYKYAYMEETLGDTEAARSVYERWMSWEPEEAIWNSYIKFEKRYKQWSKIRNIFERLVQIHPTVTSYLQYAKFEEDGHRFAEARSIFERSTETLSLSNKEPKLFIEFAKFEIRMKEFERARVIYQYSLNLFPRKGEAEGLYNSYAQFERQFGSEQSQQHVILLKRRTLYEEILVGNPLNYDTWFDYIKLEEENGDIDVIRETYERAIANIPPAPEKRLWRRYIYFWIYYAVFEEVVAKDVDRTLGVYKAALAIIPHTTFTFAKVWIMKAHFHIRQLDVTSARRTMGTALGLASKPKIFKDYIEMEVQLREFDRCRILYEKYIAYDPTNSETWINFAELETLLMDEERARGIYEVAIEQQVDMPESLWKSYIDFEVEAYNYSAARALYERLLQRTEHLKVWISYANFEATIPSDDAQILTRAVFTRAYESLKTHGLVTERILLLESWKEIEMNFSDGDADSINVQNLIKMMPRVVEKRRKTEVEGEWEEDIQYVFPEDEVKTTATDKLLAMAHKWKQTSNTNE